MDSIPQWFPGVTLNFAENVLYTQKSDSKDEPCTIGKEDDKIALTEVREGVTEIRSVTWSELRSGVGRLTQAMRAAGVEKGDRIAVVASNSIDTLQVFLASTALGGIFSSSSTDMGTKGILDRLLQIRPKYLFMDDSAVYNGKTVDLRNKMEEVVQGLREISEFRGLVSLPRFSSAADVSNIPRTQTLRAFLSKAPSSDLRFSRVAFHDPFLIVYSSGTTGQPKCIVHSVGGVLLSSKMVGHLHRRLTHDSVMLQYTTTGWIMYLSSIVTLIHGSRVVLYDGSPFLPDVQTFVRLIGDQHVTHLGISPRYLSELHGKNVIPCKVTNLSALQLVTSTGMVLPDQLFHWFYDTAFPSHTQLANISGGTDIAGAFALENPLEPVYVGGCQGPCLGTPIDIYDATIEGGEGIKGKAVKNDEPGELVATQAFPNMPVSFWADSSGKKYREAYFARFDNVWTHGDFIQRHPITGSIIFLGRADGVLNPSGVRFGSAEIYNVLEKNFAKEVADSVCVGQKRERDVDERVMLFLLMREGGRFGEELIERVRNAIRRELSPRHVPTFVFETPEIPVCGYSPVSSLFFMHVFACLVALVSDSAFLIRLASFPPSISLSV